MDDIKIHYTRPMFEDQMVPVGHLTVDIRSHACWYYACLAEKNRQRVGRGPEDQIITYDAFNNEKAVYENKNFKAIAKSVATIYGLESPDEFLRFREIVEAEGRRIGITFGDEIWRPLTTIIH